MALVVFALFLAALAALAVTRARRDGPSAGLVVLTAPLLALVEVAFYGIPAATIAAALAGSGLLAVHEADRRRRRAERDRARRARRTTDWPQAYADAA